MLHPANPLAASLRQAASAHLANAIERLRWHGSRVHEGIHQARKSLRLARAILALGGPVLGPGAVLIDREVQQLNRDLSKWRDGQALVEAVGRLLKRETDPECMAILRRSQQEAARVRAELGHAAEGDDSPLPTMRKLLKTLHMALPSLAWRSITASVMNAALARSGGRRAEAIYRALSDGKANDWHRLRKRVRRLTQQYAVIEDLGIDEIVTPSDTVKEQEQKLAKRLGQAQDYVLLLDRCDDHSVFDGADRKVLCAFARRQLKRSRRKATRLVSGPPAQT